MAELDTTRTDDSGADAIILAAGKGTRMEGDLAKVLFPVADRPMLWWVVRACRRAGVRRCVVVVGYQAGAVQDAMAEEPSCAFVEQVEQLGTGHAAQMAAPQFDPAASRDVFVLAGDGPLIRPAILERMLETHRREKAAATIATAVVDDPEGYGRIVRDDKGRFEAIVEQKDATAAQRGIREINVSYYCFDSALLFDALERVGNDNEQGEFYLTDVPELLRRDGRRVALLEAVAPEDVLGVNTPQQLAEVDQILRARRQPR
ncbi:MAG: glycosyl transferase family 2 [Phycisphaeraceae bacterium]|nr:glycosyl transferase family 2 [Phycisphaeraceae bacterium]